MAATALAQAFERAGVSEKNAADRAAESAAFQAVEFWMKRVGASRDIGYGLIDRVVERLSQRGQSPIANGGHIRCAPAGNPIPHEGLVRDAGNGHVEIADVGNSLASQGHRAFAGNGQTGLAPVGNHIPHEGQSGIASNGPSRNAIVGNSLASQRQDVSAWKGHPADAEAGNSLGVEGQLGHAAAGQLRLANDTNTNSSEGLGQPAGNGQCTGANAAITTLGPTQERIKAMAKVADALAYRAFGEDYRGKAYCDIRRRSRMDIAILNYLGVVPPERQGEDIDKLISIEEFKDIKTRVERSNDEG